MEFLYSKLIFLYFVYDESTEFGYANFEVSCPDRGVPSYTLKHTCVHIKIKQIDSIFLKKKNIFPTVWGV